MSWLLKPIHCNILSLNVYLGKKTHRIFTLLLFSSNILRSPSQLLLPTFLDIHLCHHTQKQK